MRSLSSRLSAMKKIRYLASFKNRKMIAEGIFMSKLSYLIALWGGCGAGLKKSLQVLQNTTDDFLLHSTLIVQGKAD